MPVYNKKGSLVMKRKSGYHLFGVTFYFYILVFKGGLT